jgi:hypothetical protein
LHVIKAKQSLNFNQPSPEYTLPNQPVNIEGENFFTQSFRSLPLAEIHSPIPLSPAPRIARPERSAREPGIQSHPSLRKFNSLLGRKPTDQSHSLDSRCGQTPGNS